MNDQNGHTLALIIPNASHEIEYARVMDKWEALESNIQPELMRRYSKNTGQNVSFDKWLEWCEDDRTTGSMLSTGVSATLFFLICDCAEIVGSIVINHGDTHRGHVHAGIVPWCRCRGYGTKMLNLALNRCREMGITKVHIVPHADNIGAIETIIKNGGKLVDEFCEDGIKSMRYEIDMIN